MAQTKDVTRRVGWKNLKEGEILQGVKKAQGLKRGEKIERLGPIRVVSVRFEPLSRLIEEPEYGKIEVAREGFPEWDAADFIAFFIVSHPVTLYDDITRIEYVYL